MVVVDRAGLEFTVGFLLLWQSYRERFALKIPCPGSVGVDAWCPALAGDCPAGLGEPRFQHASIWLSEGARRADAAQRKNHQRDQKHDNDSNDPYATLRGLGRLCRMVV